MLKKIPVVMLPTEKASSLFLGLTGRLKFDNKQLSTHPKIINQHLYFLSDEEIKEGDCIYNIITNSIVINWGGHGSMEHWKKIIATTDESLFEQIFYHPDGAIIGGIESYKLLPRPSQSFIERFMEKYNVGTPITHVMVEYVNLEPNEQGLILKIAKDNTITIKPVKDSWNRKELTDLVYQFNTTHGNMLPYSRISNWIEQNL